MNKALDLLRRLASGDNRGDFFISNELLKEIQELLAQPEQDAITDKPTATFMAVMPNGVCVSNVYDAYEAGRKSVIAEQTEQEPVAWMQDSIELYVLEEKSAIRGYVIPLYTAPPKREPLSDGTTADMWHVNKKATHADSYWAGVYDAEKAHGIGGE